MHLLAYQIIQQTAADLRMAGCSYITRHAHFVDSPDPVSYTVRVIPSGLVSR